MSRPKEFKRTTVTAALPYANGPIHIGHMAGVYIPSDIYVRYLRQKGQDVLFVCGSDEHGVPITLRAKDEGISPQEIVDRFHKQIQDSFEQFGITFDHYSRTSSKVHYQTASDFFTQLDKKGILDEKESEQFYDQEANQFLADRYIMGTCPNCGFEEAYGDQCENCGTSLSPNDLKDPKSMLSGAKPILKRTKHWYLPLDKYETWLKEYILEGHKEWKVNVYGQCQSWINQGLQPRAVTRDLDWGVPVPREDGEGKVLYVWFDAPIGYISASKEWADANDKDWEKYWKDPETRILHFIGKDNIVFHCIIFPTMLHAHGDFRVADNVPANEFLNLEGKKLSTSRNWAVWLHEYIEDFPGKEDVLRYALCSNMPETKDNDFSWKEFQARNNNELVAILGNFVNRALVLCHKYFNGQIPEKGNLIEADEKVLSKVRDLPNKISSSLEDFKFRDALNHFMEIARMGNKYLADNEPWKLIKTDENRVKTILNTSLQIAALISLYGEPFLPNTCKKLKNLLGLGGFMKNLIKTDQDKLKILIHSTVLPWGWRLNSDLLAEGGNLEKPELLFSKIEDDQIQAQLEKLGQPENDQKKNSKPMIKFEDFEKLDLKLAEIKEAKKVPETDKLLELKLLVGDEERTVVSGIAQSYPPENAIGQKVLYLQNLEPRKIRGVLSEGMILMAEDDSGGLSFLIPEKAMPSGSAVR